MASLLRDPKNFFPDQDRQPPKATRREQLEAPSASQYPVVPGEINRNPALGRMALAHREPTVSYPPDEGVLQEERFFERVTISDDRSAGSNLEARNLVALKDRNALPSNRESNLSHPRNWAAPSQSFPRYDDLPPPVDDPMLLPPSPSSRQRRIPLNREFSQGPSRRFGRLDHKDIFNDGSNDLSGEFAKDVHESQAQFASQYQNTASVSKKIWVDDLENHDTGSSLQTEIETVQNKISEMQSTLRHLESHKNRDDSKRYEILYRINGTCYFDHPEWTAGRKSIVSRIPVKNLDLFLERNKRIVFIVCRDFEALPTHKHAKNSAGQPKFSRESILPVSKRLLKALETILKHDWRYKAAHDQLRYGSELNAPYLFIYHHRQSWKDMLAQFPQSIRECLNLLAVYVSENYGDEYEAADNALAQHKIPANLVKYMFQPGDILLSRAGGNYRGVVAESWPQELIAKSTFVSRESAHEDDETDSSVSQDYESSEYSRTDFYGHGVQDDLPRTEELFMDGSYEQEFPRKQPWFLKPGEDKEKSTPPASTNIEFEFRVWKWSFDGDFKRESERVTLRLSDPAGEKSTSSKTWVIHDLDIYPLKFASKSLLDDLHHRGKMFWECRKRCLISYRNKNPESQDESDERFMIDFHTFRKLHPENKSNTIITPVETMTQTEMDQAQPPSESFYYLVPLQTKGFNLRTKKWLDLDMDQISPVVWNQKAFDTLVLDRKTKELITALVSKQISAAKSTDVIAGKGNGLILLLHGGPGTGKTLTAEGVAEIAKKPLYRVTCGDVGTKAEEVEGYLESVLHLGKIWDCVVLLDEAEVFLERRSLDDLQRNALVSVFLRVIEYHEGILILTSNRVGTFDEAFRSRIQIAVHYPPLRAFQRSQIWKNFFDRLESFQDGTVDVDELRDHLEELQEIEINGRQIRNAITTARQYAEWKNKGPMNYEHLKIALAVASRFDDYSEKLRGGLTDDEIAKEEGIR